ncbi:MAG: class I SAM-dependent methyltransferase [Acidimicrobiia bacterium]|nr:class I SAM-dependent methyltransferase [Acidimicrobiia bacterium]
MRTEWEDLAEWWQQELADDSGYAEEALPLLLDLLDPRPGNRYLDAGCGDGRVMRAVVETGATVIGCDLNLELLRLAKAEGPVVGCRLPNLDWIRPATFDGAYASLVVEHLVDLASFFAGLAEAVRFGGPLALVVNHPLFTAPESGPVVDPTDGEVFWRWGTYLEDGYTEEPAGAGRVTFYHRPLATLLNAAADAGWSLERTVERGVPTTTRDPLLASQGHIPRLLGVRWTRGEEDF